VQPAKYMGHSLADPGAVDWPIVLFREIDIVGNQCLEMNDLLTQLGDPACEVTRKLVYRRLMHSPRAGIDQIADGFGFDEIDLAVENRALRELSGPSRPGTSGYK